MDFIFKFVALAEFTCVFYWINNEVWVGVGEIDP